MQSAGRCFIIDGLCNTRNGGAWNCRQDLRGGVEESRSCRQMFSCRHALVSLLAVHVFGGTVQAGPVALITAASGGGNSDTHQ
jgi:hypothetical protein